MREPTDRPRRFVAGAAFAVLAAAPLAFGAVWTGALSSPERLLARIYQTAFADTGPQNVALRLMPTALREPAEQRPIDALWAGAGADDGTALRRPLVIGDHITISSRDGGPERLAIIGLKRIEGTAFGAPGIRFQLVTCRQDDAGGGLVRFLMAIDQPSQPVRPAGDKTL